MDFATRIGEFIGRMPGWAFWPLMTVVIIGCILWAWAYFFMTGAPAIQKPLHKTRKDKVSHDKK